MIRMRKDRDGLMTIPEIRDEMKIIANRIRRYFPDTAHDLEFLAEQTKRRRMATGPRKRVFRKITPAIAAEIRQYHADNPTATQEQIGIALNVGTGRVSEVLWGKRDE